MKAILLNDTDAGRHIGCELVVRNTFTLCRQHGIDITHTVKSKEAHQAEAVIVPLLQQNDLVLLNGEGTLHDDKSRALSLLKLAALAKQAGLKTVLYNTLWSNNPVGQQYLPYFDLIFCRDGESANEIRNLHPTLDVRTVPDMIFTTQLTESESPRPRSSMALVTDSVKKKHCYQLAKFAVRNRLTFAPMGTGFHERVDSSYFLKWRLTRHCGYHHNQLDSAESFVEKIQTSRSVITGRFHTACLALLLQTPVCCISSNTRKIETLYSDFGLSPNLVGQSISSLVEAEAQWEEQVQHRESIHEKVSEARAKIDGMFQLICRLCDGTN
ncbi:MAG: polysaccharide pyruvyl transferase family protein [Opitutae bacterium]|nr:polysaccharide pyruvyl transferase family protein [Opitutae bacterium]